jgi:hypothetical protein
MNKVVKLGPVAPPARMVKAAMRGCIARAAADAHREGRDGLLRSARS